MNIDMLNLLMYRTGKGLKPTLNPNPSQSSSLEHGTPHSVLGKLLRFLKDKAHWGFPFPSPFADAQLSLLFLILSQGPTVSFLTAYAWFTLHDLQSCQIFVLLEMLQYVVHTTWMGSDGGHTRKVTWEMTLKYKTNSWWSQVLEMDACQTQALMVVCFFVFQ